MKPIACVDSKMFLMNVSLKDTDHLKIDRQNIILIMDGYAFNVSLWTLSSKKENYVLVVGLHTHRSHVLQALDISVFGRLKRDFRGLINMWTLTTRKVYRNDISTVCQLLWNAYHACVNPQNVILGFRRTDMWSDDLQGVDIDKIITTDLKYAPV